MQRSPFPYMGNPGQETFNPHYHESYRFGSNPYPMPQQAVQRKRQPFNKHQAPHRHNFGQEHWCETCDRSFNSLELLERHKQQHQKCNIDGCQFVAHPKVITRHIQMQHSSGLYKKIANLNNPEEIKKWREERKKRYPTKINIEKKAAEMKEKIDRGEKMGLNQKRRHNQFDRANGQHKKQSQNKDENNQQNRLRQYGKLGKPSSNKIRKPKLPRKVHTVIPSTNSIGKLKPFAGIQDIVMENTTEDTMEETNCKFIIEDEDCDGLPIMNEETATESKPIVCGALSSLMYDYDSSEDDMGNSDIAKLNKINEPKENNVTLQINSNSITVIENIENKQSGAKSDDDGPEEMKIQKHAETNANEEPLKVAEPRNNKKKIFTDKKPIKNQYTKPKYKVPSTLLQRLLRREVQQERNIVLQCVRHIVKNNFFDKS